MGRDTRTWQAPHPTCTPSPVKCEFSEDSVNDLIKFVAAMLQMLPVFARPIALAWTTHGNAVFGWDGECDHVLLPVGYQRLQYSTTTGINSDKLSTSERR